MPQQSLSNMNTTLHQLVTSPKAWGDDIERIQKVWQAQDLLLLLGEAAQGYQDERLQQFSNLALLSTDAALLGFVDSPSAQLQVFSSEDWANAVLNYQRCITWR